MNISLCRGQGVLSFNLLYYSVGERKFFSENDAGKSAYPHIRELILPHIIHICIYGFPPGFSDGLNDKESPCNAGDLGSILGSVRSPGEGTGNSFQYSFQENSTDRGAWWATIHGVTKSWT